MPCEFSAGFRAVDTSYRAEALSALAVRLPEPRINPAMKKNRLAGSLIRWAKSLPAWVAQYLHCRVNKSETLAQALADARSIDSMVRPLVLTSVASQLPEPDKSEILAQVLADVPAIGDHYFQARALSALAPHLPEGLLAKALEAARAMDHALYRAEALSSLAPHLPKGLLSEALEAAQAFDDLNCRAKALSALAPHLPEDLQADAQKAAQAIDDVTNRNRVLAALLPYLPASHKSEALTEVLAAYSPRSRDATSSALTPSLPDGLLEVVQTTAYVEAKVSTLSALAPYLPEGMLAQALDDTQGMKDDEARVSTLMALVPHLSEKLLPKAVHIALSIPYSWFTARCGPLSVLVPRLVTLPSSSLYPLWSTSLPILAARTRNELLQDLLACVPILIKLGGSTAASQTYQAIRDIGTWWP